MTGTWKYPKRLGESVRVKDEASEHYAKVGYKQGSRSDGKVLVFFPATKTTGNMAELDWEQCERVK